jgi:hypothetical protein
LTTPIITELYGKPLEETPMKKLYLLMILLIFPVNANSVEIKPFFDFGGSFLLTPKELDAFAPFEIGIRDMYEDGVNIGLGIGFTINPRIELAARISSSFFRLKMKNLFDRFTEQYLLSGIVPINTPFTYSYDMYTSDEFLWLNEIMADARIFIRAVDKNMRVKPYVIVGSGVTQADIPPLELEASVHYLDEGDTISIDVPGKEEYKFAFNVGVGLDIMLKENLDLFLEVKYARVAASEEPINYLPVVLGVKSDWRELKKIF